MAKLDYYEILGISKNAEDREIKRAYKKLAIKFHPDRNPGNTEAATKFKEIKEAYEVLIDPQKRAMYNQYGHTFDNNTSHTESYTNNDFSSIFGDVFSDIFGENKKHNRGADLCYNMDLSLEEAVRGVSKKINLPILDRCEICHGSGAKPGTPIINCQTCKGKGQIHMRQGFFTVQQTCPICQGQGKKIKIFCSLCRGQGRVKKSKILSIKIPAGVNTGDRIRLSGEGELNEYGISGDLYVQIKILKHSLFEREDNNIYCEIPINFVTAALGGELEVPTLDGWVKLKIPPETQTGKLFRIRGKGIKSIKKNLKGDLLCRVIIETPVKLDEYQRNLLYKLNDSFLHPNKINNSPKFKSFLDGVKKFFENLTK